jgi:hypothetical protein
VVKGHVSIIIAARYASGRVKVTIASLLKMSPSGREKTQSLTTLGYREAMAERRRLQMEREAAQ